MKTDKLIEQIKAAQEALAYYYADKTNWIETSAANDDPNDGRLRDVWNGGLEDSKTRAAIQNEENGNDRQD